MKQAINMPMTALEWGLLVALSVLWGGSFFFVAVAVEALPPLTIVTLRVGIAAAILWLVLAPGGAKGLLEPRLWPAFFAMGLMNNVIPFSLIVWGQSQIASGLASILNAATPLATVVAASELSPAPTRWLTPPTRGRLRRGTGIT